MLMQDILQLKWHTKYPRFPSRNFCFAAIVMSLCYTCQTRSSPDSNMALHWSNPGLNLGAITPKGGERKPLLLFFPFVEQPLVNPSFLLRSCPLTQSMAAQQLGREGRAPESRRDGDRGEGVEGKVREMERTEQGREEGR